MPFVSIADDFGDIVHGIFLDPEKWDGKVVHAVSQVMSYSELVETFQEGTFYLPFPTPPNPY